MREETRRGKRFLSIDIRYRALDGSRARYRRDADAATKTATRDEERRIRDRIARTGSPFEEPTPPTEEQSPPFALIAYAGLRPNEVRALLRRDQHLHREAGEPVGGFLSIREGRSFGETDTPKTGRREVPIIPPLARLLAPVEAGPKDGHLALTVRGQPWGQ